MKTRRLSFAHGNKWELYISIALPFLTTPYYAVLPRGYQDLLIGTGVFTVAFICALNAVLDWKRMVWPERIIAVPWFCALAIALPIALWNVSQYKVFADR
jgi:hypothetical protein